ncbi:pimeloyl-ACP methyl ester carboxylesterase [Brevibacterium sanguinis]|uniref:Pimeloyl-ACP methyl ester carboxylesterase n=2 Tax=Brevibacterium TaxID=1696 RepID=A0A366IMC8_9MICO|nr:MULTISPECIES: alpha/beta hydrolase [Brevibacterium]RBP66199.1 pimeloyl-ACP methyl ester carboxylesterase [Brevibacterium sanguinis]RBP72850.1 pimeloyl-ACP methyl ester carboxylesterase [Brevibacterium celere]
MEASLSVLDDSAWSGEHQHFRQLRLAVFADRGLAPREHQFIRRDGRRLYALSFGEGEHPTLFVHGGVGNSAEWADVVGLVPGLVVVVDTPGFGLSEPVASPDIEWGPACAEWLLDVCDALGVSRLRIVGGSMGGYAAIHFAAAHRHRVESLTLAGSAGGLFADIGTFLRLWTVPGLGRLVAQLPMRDIDAVRRHMFGHYVSDASTIAEDLLRLALAGVNLPGARTHSRAVIRSVATVRGWKPSARAEDQLVSADVPTTFVWGDHDVHASPETAHDLAARLTDARVVVVPGAGHIPHLEQPKVLAAALE